jgi:uncharacterized protein YydD (DUF2326 family)
MVSSIKERSIGAYTEKINCIKLSFASFIAATICYNLLVHDGSPSNHEKPPSKQPFVFMKTGAVLFFIRRIEHNC